MMEIVFFYKVFRIVSVHWFQREKLFALYALTIKYQHFWIKKNFFFSSVLLYVICILKRFLYFDSANQKNLILWFSLTFWCFTVFFRKMFYENFALLGCWLALQPHWGRFGIEVIHLVGWKVVGKIICKSGDFIKGFLRAQIVFLKFFLRTFNGLC